MDIAIESLPREIAKGLIFPKETAKDLDLFTEDESRSGAQLTSAILNHYKTVRAAPVPRRPKIAPRSHWGRPPQLRALAKLAEQPIYVIDDLDDSTFVQKYSFDRESDVGSVKALSTEDAEREFANSPVCIYPIVLVQRHALSHFDALPIRVTHPLPCDVNASKRVAKKPHKEKP